MILFIFSAGRNDSVLDMKEIYRSFPIEISIKCKVDIPDNEIVVSSWTGKMVIDDKQPKITWELVAQMEAAVRGRIILLQKTLDREFSNISPEKNRNIRIESRIEGAIKLLNFLSDQMKMLKNSALKFQGSLDLSRDRTGLERAKEASQPQKQEKKRKNLDDSISPPLSKKQKVSTEQTGSKNIIVLRKKGKGEDIYSPTPFEFNNKIKALQIPIDSLSTSLTD
jgi:hypothetical protein